MKLFSYINVEPELQKIISLRMLEYITDHTAFLQNNLFLNHLVIKKVLDFNKELNWFLNHYNFSEVKIITIFKVTQATTTRPHIDVTRYRYRLLWPVKNCEGSYTKLYHLNDNEIENKMLQNIGEFKIASHDGPYNELDSIELTKPVIFDSYIPHAIHVNTLFTEPRLTFSVGFKEPPLGFLL